MGVDKSNIRTVIHFELPGSAESYLQESGRAGRDRKTAHAFALYCSSDRKKGELYKSEVQRERYLKLLAFAETETECRRNVLLRALSEDSATDFCEGCDICDETYKPEAEGKKEIIKLIKNNQRTLTLNNAVSILKGTDNAFKKGDFIMFSESYGELSEWPESAVKEAVNSLIQEGIIRSGKYLWKNLLSYSGKPQNNRFQQITRT